MIVDKRMEFVKSENGINYYLLTPSFFSLYYDKKSKYVDAPAHINTLTHRLHMWWYILRSSRYKILYLERDEEILSYIIFVKANNKIIKNCGNNDYYTIFLWTYPEHRGKGLATLMAKTMLNDLSLKYDCFYKTIHRDNISSMRVAEKCGFKVKGTAIKTRWVHTIHKAEDQDLYLYYYSAV